MLQSLRSLQQTHGGITAKTTLVVLEVCCINQPSIRHRDQFSKTPPRAPTQTHETECGTDDGGKLSMEEGQAVQLIKHVVSEETSPRAPGQGAGSSLEVRSRKSKRKGRVQDENETVKRCRGVYFECTKILLVLKGLKAT